MIDYVAHKLWDSCIYCGSSFTTEAVWEKTLVDLKPWLFQTAVWLETANHHMTTKHVPVWVYECSCVSVCVYLCSNNTLALAASASGELKMKLL